ncbi:MAG: hypothetical protein ABSG83_15585 [Roseiarcus sp.]
MDGLERIRTSSRSGVGIGVRAQLSLVVLIAILPLLALLLFGAIENRRMILESAATHALDLARFGAQRQDDGFLAARAVLSALRSVPRATLTNPDDCHAALAGIGADHPQFDSLGLVDSGGVIYCLSTPAEPRPFGDAELLAAARAGDRASVVVGKYSAGSAAGGRTPEPLSSPLSASTSTGRRGMPGTSNDRRMRPCRSSTPAARRFWRGLRVRPDLSGPPWRGRRSRRR